MRALSLSLIFLTGLLFETSALAQKAVLIEDAENAGAAAEDAAKVVGRKVERSSTVRKFFHEEEFVGYDSTYAMRSDRRVGVGAEIEGKLGLLGVTAELNFAIDDSAVLGFGGGPQYSSFELGWKHVFGGKMIAPYVGAAYSRWYNNSSSGSIGGTTPSFLSDKFLNSSQQQSGQFAVNFLAPSAGLQFNMLNGEYAGTSIYAEVMALVSLSNLQSVLNGTFGIAYYF